MTVFPEDVFREKGIPARFYLDEHNRQFAEVSCVECGSSFSRRVVTLVESIQHEPPRLFCCVECGKKYTEKQLATQPKSLPPYFATPSFSSDTAIGCGRAGEHFVMSELLIGGYSACLAEQGMPFDVVLFNNNKTHRIQVKTTVKRSMAPGRLDPFPVYKWNVRHCGKGGKETYKQEDFDILALVALDIRCVAYFKAMATYPSSINLFPPGTPRNSTRRNGNVDEYPIHGVLY